MSTDLKNKKALITGSSQGIGRAIAVGLAKCGCDVYVNYVGNDEKASETKRLIDEIGMGKCTLVKADLKSADCADVIKNITGEIDILILNASIQYRNKWVNITIEEFDDQIYCNLRSSMLLMQSFIPSMVKKGKGRVITIGSVQEKKPHADMLVYSASKAALTSMAQSLALQLADSGVSVNSVAPGVIYTDRNMTALADENYALEVKNKIPMGRWGNPEDCVEVVKMLCSDGADYITGQNIFVDGGMGIK